MLSTKTLVVMLNREEHPHHLVSLSRILSMTHVGAEPLIVKRNPRLEWFGANQVLVRACCKSPADSPGNSKCPLCAVDRFESPVRRSSKKYFHFFSFFSCAL